MKSTSSASSIRASAMWPMRHFAMTGIDDRLLDLADLLDRRHAGDTALGPDVGRHPLQRHHRRRARVLRDLRLLGGGDVHDHATLEHLRQTDLDPELVVA